MLSKEKVFRAALDIATHPDIDVNVDVRSQALEVMPKLRQVWDDYNENPAKNRKVEYHELSRGCSDFEEDCWWELQDAVIVEKLFIIADIFRRCGINPDRVSEENIKTVRPEIIKSTSYVYICPYCKVREHWDEALKEIKCRGCDNKYLGETVE